MLARKVSDFTFLDSLTQMERRVGQDREDGGRRGDEESESEEGAGERGGREDAWTQAKTGRSKGRY